MCGIHGYVTGKVRNVHADDFLSNGFVAGSLRGTDASGIAVINAAKAQSAWQKLPVPGSMFIGNNYVRTLMRDACDANTIAIAHTRAATTSGVGIDGAHPFSVDDANGREIVGVHNGTLQGWGTKPNGNKYTVDSEWALNHIFDNGIKAFEDFTGAYCFVWWDSDEQDTLNIALNNDRPMCVGFTKQEGMTYASEAGMLYWLMERNLIDIDGPILQLTGKHWYKFKIDELKAYTKVALPEPKATAVVPYTSYTPSAPMKTTVDRVTELLTLIGKKVTSQATGTAVVPYKQAARAEEILKAKQLNLMGCKGTFQPDYLDTNTNDLLGTFANEAGTELTAFIRGAENLIFGPATLWNTRCIGIQDDNFDIVAVCSAPNFAINNGEPVPEMALLN